MPLPVNTVVATVARMPAVNGVAVGEGLAFTLVPDVRVAWEHARSGSAFIKAGFSSMDMGTSCSEVDPL